jgi:hypothetical protein
MPDEERPQNVLAQATLSALQAYQQQKAEQHRQVHEALGRALAARQGEPGDDPNREEGDQ